MSVTVPIGATHTYAMDVFPLPPVEVNPAPLDLTILGTNVWLTCEFDHRVYSLPLNAAAGTVMTAEEVPAPVAPLFRSTFFNQDIPHAMSQSNERIQTTADGSLWMSQGGNYLYGGKGSNWSRIMRRWPNGTWSSYLLPWNSAGITGFYAENNGTVWVSASNPNAGNVIAMTRTVAWPQTLSDPTRDPNVVRAGSDPFTGWKLFDLGTAKHAFPAHIRKGPQDGLLYVMLYWDSAFLTIDPKTYAMVRHDLTPPPPGTLMNSSGPYQMLFGQLGGLWIAEDYARRVTRYRPSDGDQAVLPLAALLDSQEHPHSLAGDGFDVVLTTYSNSATGIGRIGRITNTTTVELSSPFTDYGILGGLSGVTVEPDGTLWVCLFRQKAIARLTPLP